MGIFKTESPEKARFILLLDNSKMPTTNTLVHFDLAECYAKGIGTKIDHQKAFEWYLKAADQGHAEAQFTVGHYYKVGEVVTRDLKMAFEWYLKATKQGHVDAQYMVGECYKNGIGVTRDPKMATELYLKAAEQGNAEAQYNLGDCYKNERDDCCNTDYLFTRDEDNLAIDNAAMNGHIDIVKFLHEKRSEGCTVFAMNQAASKGHLEVVKWLHENRSEGCTTEAMNLAAQNGHLEVDCGNVCLQSLVSMKKMTYSKNQKC